MRLLNDFGVVAAALLLFGGMAQAQTVSVQSSAHPDSDITLLSLPGGGSGLDTNQTINFGTDNSDTISFTGGSGVYSGTSTGLSAAPYTPTGRDTSSYLVAETNSSVTITYSTTQQNFSLLWGSVDTSNTLNFYNGTTLVGTVTGSEVEANANGAQDSTGSYYVTISNLLGGGFTSVVATQDGRSPAFEFSPAVSQASPAPMAMFGGSWWAGLLIAMSFFTLRRRMQG
jgi:hypothetical protein